MSVHSHKIPVGAPGKARVCLPGRLGFKIAVCLITTLLLAGCTNSKLVIAPLYNQLDNRMRSEFNELGDFTEAQTTAFEAAVGTYHVWHRQSEMPKYAALMQEIALSLAEPGKTTREDLERWSTVAEHYSLRARECHPINHLFDMIRTLSDEQLNDIEQRLQKNRQEYRLEYEARTPSERIERRIEKLEKWAGRINLNLTQTQLDDLRDTLERQVSLRTQYFELTDQWRAEFLAIARDRQAPDFHARLSAHMQTLWSLLETNYPEQWQQNRALWQASTQRIIESLSDEQRSNASQWLTKMSNTVASIATDEPSFTVGDDPAVGCLVDSSS